MYDYFLCLLGLILVLFYKKLWNIIQLEYQEQLFKKIEEAVKNGIYSNVSELVIVATITHLRELNK